MTFRCHTHGPVEATLQWHPVGAAPRIRASCERCGRYIQWAPLTPANILRADAAGDRPSRKRTNPHAAEPTLRCEEKARRLIDEALRRIESRFPNESDTLRELLDLLVLAASERSLRYATMAALRVCDDFEVSAGYRAALLTEIETWKHADVDPVFGGPADRTAFAVGAPGRPALASDLPAGTDGPGPRLPRDGGQLSLLGEP